MRESHVQDISDVDVLVERLLNEVLRFIAGQLGDAGIEEDEPKIQRRPEHEHVGMKLQLRYGRRRKRMTNSHKAHVLQLDASARRADGVAASVGRVDRLTRRGHRERPHF